MSPSNAFWLRRGAGEGKAPPPAFAWASLGIYSLSEMGGLFLTPFALFFAKRRGC
jgi:hypothetical protein